MMKAVLGESPWSPKDHVAMSGIKPDSNSRCLDWMLNLSEHIALRLQRRADVNGC